MNIILIVNSHLTRPGNFGVRAKRICDFLEQENINFLCISRGGGGRHSSYINLKFFGFFARLINFVRLRLYKNLNHRRYERAVFEFFILRILNNKNLSDTVVHLWEYSPRIIRHIQQKGGRVVLETPNVTLNYVRGLKGTGVYPYLSYHSSQEEAEFKSIKLADLVISPSQFVKDNIINECQTTNIVTVPFAFPEHDYHFQPKEHKTELNLLFVGNIDYRKGVGEIIKVMNDLKSENIQLICLGRMGTIGREFYQSLPENIEYKGFADPKEFYKKADAFIFPSWCEGSAKAVYEAMSYGNAIITTEAAGSLVDHQSEGLIVPPGDCTAIKQAVMALAQDHALLNRLRKNAFEKSKQRSWHHYTSDVLSQYRSVQ